MPNDYVQNENLRLLWGEMRKLGITRQTFELTIKGRIGRSISFGAIFITDEDPWTIRLAARGIHQRYERVRVYPGFKMYVGDLSRDFMTWLRDVLDLECDPDNPFTERQFLSNELARQSPSRLKHKKVAPSDVPIDRSTVEESEKVYFVRWLPWGAGRHVTEENLRKTGELISWDAERICRKYNISTCWSANAWDANEIGDPIEARNRADDVRRLQSVGAERDGDPATREDKMEVSEAIIDSAHHESACQEPVAFSASNVQASAYSAEPRKRQACYFDENSSHPELCVRGNGHPENPRNLKEFAPSGRQEPLRGTGGLLSRIGRWLGFS